MAGPNSESGQRENPEELTLVSDSGAREQPTHLRLEKSPSYTL